MPRAAILLSHRPPTPDQSLTSKTTAHLRLWWRHQPLLVSLLLVMRLQPQTALYYSQHPQVVALPSDAPLLFLPRLSVLDVGSNVELLVLTLRVRPSVIPTTPKSSLLSYLPMPLVAHGYTPMKPERFLITVPHRSAFGAWIAPSQRCGNEY
jgi:hypothetical protein